MTELCSQCGKDVTNEGVIYENDKPWCCDCHQTKLRKIIEEQEKLDKIGVIE